MGLAFWQPVTQVLPFGQIAVNEPDLFLRRFINDSELNSYALSDLESGIVSPTPVPTSGATFADDGALFSRENYIFFNTLEVERLNLGTGVVETVSNAHNTGAEGGEQWPLRKLTANTATGTLFIKQDEFQTGFPEPLTVQKYDLTTLSPATGSPLGSDDAVLNASEDILSLCATSSILGVVWINGESGYAIRLFDLPGITTLASYTAAWMGAETLLLAATTAYAGGSPGDAFFLRPSAAATSIHVVYFDLVTAELPLPAGTTAGEFQYAMDTNPAAGASLYMLHSSGRLGKYEGGTFTWLTFTSTSPTAEPGNSFAVGGGTLLANAYNSGVPFPDQVQMLKDLGASFYRAPLRPNELNELSESDANVLFSTTLDQNTKGMVTQLLAEGIPTLGVIYDRLYNDEGNVSAVWSGTIPEAYTAGYLLTNGIVQQYGHHFTHFELTNEIDLTRELKVGNLGMVSGDYITIGGNHTPDIVAAYISGMNDGVKDAKPSAITMFNFTGYYPTYLMDQVLAAIATGTHDMDLISIHVYNEIPGAVQSNAGITDIIQDLWDMWGKKIWITELGHRFDAGATALENEQDQVDWFNGTWVTDAFASPHVDKIFWFELLSKTITGNGDMDNYGLFSFYDHATNGFSNPQPKLLAQQLML